MFLYCSLFIALTDVFCKSSYCIVRLMPSAKDCHPDGGDCALEQDERMRGRREKDRMGAEVSSVRRSGGLCGARPALPQGGGSWF